MFSLLQPWSSASPGQAHLWITYGWLAVCSVAPIVVVLIIWATCMHYTYRQKWRTLDVLLGAALLQELPNALLVLIIGAVKSALIHLPRNLQAHSLFCYFLVWSSTTSRFFQFAILTSLIVDRALILKWPYRYRFAVRHSQIRVYLVIMAFLAMLVGGCAIVSHFYRVESDTMSIGKSNPLLDEYHRLSLMNQSSPSTAAINQTSPTAVASVAMPTTASWPLSQQHNVYRFTYNLSSFEVYFNCFFVSVYALFSLLSVVCFFFVECNRPRSGLSSSSTSSSSATSKNRYLPSIATLFTTATNTSTTSSSTSSSLSTSSPLPARFSSMANMANAAVLPGGANQHGHANAHHHHHQQQQQQQQHLQKHSSQQANNFYSSNGKREQGHTPTGAAAPSPSSRTQSETLNSLYPISIVDIMGNETGQVMSSGYPSMIATDSSIYRMIETNNGSGSRSNSLSLIQGNHGESKQSEMMASTPTNTSFQMQHRSNLSASSGHFTQSDPATSLDPLNPTSCSSRVNSFSKAHLYSTASSQLKLNTTDSNDSSSFNPLANSAAHRSAFDFRWSSVLGPTTFCLAFNHGPYLIFSLLSLVMPEMWTPFHDLILVGLSLFEALLLPLIFFISDVTFREAVKKSCYCGGGRQRRHLSDKITSKSHHHPSLAFSDRNLITPPYLKSLANPLPSKQQLSRPSSLAIQNYQSDLDLSNKDHSTSKLNKISFLKHHSDHLSSSKPVSNHATSMLDLSMSSRNAYHYGHGQGQGTRSRHSVAILPHMPNGSLTPRSSFRRRPPSVASYHYLYSSQQQQQQSPVSASSNKYPQYLFGAAPAKSESASNLPTLSGNSTNNSNSSNYFSQLSAMKNFQLKKINEVDIGDRELVQLGSNLYNVPINGGSSQQLSHNSDQQQSKGDDKHLLNTKSGQKTIKELFNGLAARSSFKRRSVRKCGSDASTFYTRRNLKRSQIAHNQLSSILYNNFYIKKLGPPNFGSQLTLLSDNELIQQHENGLNSSGKEAQQHCVPALSPFSHLPSRQLSYEFGQHSPQITNPHVYLPNGANVLDSHNRSSSCNQLSVLNVDTGHYHNHLLLKQNMALQQQLSSSGHNTPRSHSGHPNNGNGDKISDYGHQQLNSDNSLLIAEEEHIYASLPEEEEDEEEGDEDDEDDAKVSSGSFSARSTLPDNCQLISYSPIASAMNNQPYHQTTNPSSVSENAGVYASKDGNFQLFGCSRLLLNESKLINGNNGSSQSSGSNSPSHSANSNSSRSNSNSHSQLSSNGDSKQFNGNLSTSSSTSTVHDTTTEDIYEEVSNLIDTTPSRHSRFINSRKQSSSQDTLIGFDGGQDCAPNSSTEYDQQLDEDQVDEDVNDDDDDDEIEDDQISMISEASSSTFSSFTTCANQDFEFIVSQYDNNAINNTAVDDDNSTRISNNNPIVNNHQRQQQQQQRNCDELYDNTPTKKKCSIIDNADQKHRQTPQQQVSNGNHNSNEVVLNVDDGEEDGNETRNKPTASVEQPSTVSMAAIYYSRYILNESCAEKKLAHRQRSKIDRRQSFSTAYELRQRILLGQLDRQQQQQQPNANGKQTALDNNDEDSHNQMNLIEEEEVEENSTNFGVHINNVDNDNEDHDNSEDRQLDYSQFTANLEEMFPYKLSRRISTSEDNLLSIISTIVNCGEDGGNGGDQEQEEDEKEQRKTNFIGTSSTTTTATAVNDNNSQPKPNKLLAKQSQDTKDNYQEQSKKNDNQNDNKNNNFNNNRKLSELKKNSTLVLSNRKDSNKLFVKNVNNTNNAQLQQANNNNNNNSNNSKQSPNSAIPRRISAVPVPAATKSFKAPQPPTTSQNNISIKELKSKRNHHHQVSSKFQEIARTATSTTTPTTNGNKLLKPNPERICELGSLWDRSASNPNSRHQSPLKPKTNLGANAKSNGSPVLTSSNNHNNNKGNSLTSSTSSSSSPSSPSSRVPTFIPASQIRSPQQISSGTNFQSKILPPSQYHHNNKQGPIQPKLKQNPRQNAILAKNALLLSSGIQQSSNL